MRRVVDLCNFSCKGDCKDRLIRNSIMAGLNSTKAYQQCILKGSSLTPNECIKIYQTKDATCRQVQALCPESTDCTDNTSIHKIAQYPPQQGRHSFRGRGAFRGGRHGPRGGLGGTWPWRQDYRYSTETVCENCGFRPHKSREECRTLNQECFHCGRLRHFSKMCRQNTDNQYNDKTEVKHIDMDEQSPDYAQSEYTTPYYLQMIKPKHQLSASGLKPRYTTCTTETQNTSDHCG